MHTKSFNNKAVCIYVQDTKNLNVELIGHRLTCIEDVSVFLHSSTGHVPVEYRDQFTNTSSGDCKVSDTGSMGFGSIIRNGRFWSGVSGPQHVGHTHAMMMAAWLKRRVEIDLGKHFTTTVMVDGSTITAERIDVITRLLSSPSTNFTLLSHISRSLTDANMLALDPSLIAGRSIDIDTLVRAHHAYANGSLHKMLSSSPTDPAYHMCSLGCLLMRWTQLKNLQVLGLE